MTTYQGKCHCGHHKWEFTLAEDQQNHILCECVPVGEVPNGVHSVSCNHSKLLISDVC